MGQKESAEYIDEQIRLRGWSARELARRAGVSNSSVLRALHLDADPPASYEVLVAIANALRIPPQTLFVKAGIFPKEPRTTTTQREILNICQQLPGHLQADLLRYAEYLFTQRTRLFVEERGDN